MPPDLTIRKSQSVGAVLGGVPYFKLIKKKVEGNSILTTNIDDQLVKGSIGFQSILNFFQHRAAQT